MLIIAAKDNKGISVEKYIKIYRQRSGSKIHKLHIQLCNKVGNVALKTLSFILF
jgi:hypothetical protein